jgi:hypothetical protein
MGQLTVALTASTTVEGVTHSNNGSVVLNAANVSQQSRTLDATFAKIANFSADYIAVINHGDESAFIQFISTTPSYIVFECKPGQHILIPCAFKYGGADFVVTDVKMRAETTETRVTIIGIDLL